MKKQFRKSLAVLLTLVLCVAQFAVLGINAEPVSAGDWDLSPGTFVDGSGNLVVTTRRNALAWNTVKTLTGDWSVSATIHFQGSGDQTARVVLGSTEVSGKLERSIVTVKYSNSQVLIEGQYNDQSWTTPNNFNEDWVAITGTAIDVTVAPDANGDLTVTLTDGDQYSRNKTLDLPAGFIDIIEHAGFAGIASKISFKNIVINGASLSTPPVWEADNGVTASGTTVTFPGTGGEPQARDLANTFSDHNIYEADLTYTNPDGQLRLFVEDTNKGLRYIIGLIRNSTYNQINVQIQVNDGSWTYLVNSWSDTATTDMNHHLKIELEDGLMNFTLSGAEYSKSWDELEVANLKYISLRSGSGCTVSNIAWPVQEVSSAADYNIAGHWEWNYTEDVTDGICLNVNSSAVENGTNYAWYTADTIQNASFEIKADITFSGSIGNETARIALANGTRSDAGMFSVNYSNGSIMYQLQYNNGQWITPSSGSWAAVSSPNISVTLTRVAGTNTVVVNIKNGATTVFNNTSTDFPTGAFDNMQTLGMGAFTDGRIRYSDISLESTASGAGTWDFGAGWAHSLDGNGDDVIAVTATSSSFTSTAWNITQGFEVDSACTFKTHITLGNPYTTGNDRIAVLPIADGDYATLGNITISRNPQGRGTLKYNGTTLYPLSGNISISNELDVTITKPDNVGRLFILVKSGSSELRGEITAIPAGLERIGFGTQGTSVTYSKISMSHEPILTNTAADWTNSGSGWNVTGNAGGYNVQATLAGYEENSFKTQTLLDSFSYKTSLRFVASTHIEQLAVARVILGKSDFSSIAILTITYQLTTGKTYFRWESNSNDNWSVLETSEWAAAANTPFDVELSRSTLTGAVTLTINNNFDYSITRTFNQAELQQVAKAGIAAQSSTIHFDNFSITSPLVADDHYATIGTAAINDLLGHFWDSTNNRVIPTCFGYPSNQGPNTGTVEGVPWEMATLIGAMDNLYQATGDASLSAKIVQEWNWFKGAYTKAKATNVGNGTLNVASDDAGWSAIYYIQAYRYTNDSTALNWAQTVFNNAYDRWYDKTIDGGLQYKDGETYVSLYSAALSMAAYDIYMATNDSAYLTKSRAIYDGIEEILGRKDGLYWADLGYEGAYGKERPNDIHEVGSVTYLGGNMAMAVMHTRFGFNAKAIKTANAILEKETVNGVYVNDRDAWANGFFAGRFADEVLRVPGIDAKHRDIMFASADTMYTKARTSDGYYAGAWSGPVGSSAYGNDDDAWSANGTTAADGSYPSQIMTSATTVSFITAAAIAETIMVDTFARPVLGGTYTLGAGKSVSGITVGTTVDAFKTAAAVTGFTVKVMKGSAEVTTGVIGTDMRVEILDQYGIVNAYRTLIYGDVNGDGAITVSDIISMKRFTVQLDAFHPAMNADRDGQGIVGALDIALTKESILGLGTIVQD